jgi:hypothetical protein
MSWGTGDTAPGGTGPAGAAMTISLADRAHLDDVIGTGLAGEGTVILAPGGHDPARGVVGVEGVLDEPGSEFSIDYDFFLQTQDYASSQFMAVLGPTLIRIQDGDDFESFLADLDHAYAAGVFPEFATAPAVRIADVPALGATTALDGPALRLHVDRHGAISTSPAGAPLGSLGAAFPELVSAWERANAASDLPCAVCLGRTVPEARRTEGLLRRPFAGRYLAALGALRTMTVNEIGGLRVSGFGGRLGDELADADGDAEAGVDLVDAALPVLMWSDERGYLYEPDRGRVFAVDHAAARAVESLLATGSPEAAARYASPSAVDRVGRYFAEAGVSLTSTRTPAVTR